MRQEGFVRETARAGCEQFNDNHLAGHGAVASSPSASIFACDGDLLSSRILPLPSDVLPQGRTCAEAERLHSAIGYCPPAEYETRYRETVAAQE